jgi:hypothetical protein
VKTIGPAPLQQIVCKEPHIRSNRLWPDGTHGLIGGVAIHLYSILGPEEHQ